MITLVGLGLYDEEDISLKGIKAIREADKVYCELYTSFWKGNLKNLEKLIEKKIELVSRRKLEEEINEILKDAKNEKIVILVPGDPLVATTHTSIVLEAKKRGIKTRIIHSSSIVSAVAECGLQIYRFGKIVSIPFLEKTGNVLPKSVYDSLIKNKKNDLHSLCLLDVDLENQKFMKINEAVDILLAMENEFRKNLLNENTEIVVISEIGSKKPKISFDKISEIKTKKFELPSSIIIPAKLHFLEREYLEFFKM